MAASSRRKCGNASAPEGTVCPGRTAPRWHDLTRYYDTARLERRDGRFVPDLLLTDGTGRFPKLYVEIHVSHAVTPQKAGSGVAILDQSVMARM